MAGSSLRRARSPVAPKMTSVVGWTGRRSRPSLSGLAWDSAVALMSLPRDGVPAELRAQRREHAVGEVAVAAAVEPRVEGGGDDRRRHVLVHRVLDRPAPLPRVVGVRGQAGEVV